MIGEQYSPCNELFSCGERRELWLPIFWQFSGEAVAEEDYSRPVKENIHPISQNDALALTIL